MFQNIIAVGSSASSTQGAALDIARHHPGATVDKFQLAANRPSDLLDALLTYTTEVSADLLVVSTKHQVIASRAAMLAPASVLLVPEGGPVDFSHLAVPVDFSDSSQQALRCAAGLAGADGQVTAISVECDDEPWLDWPSDHGRVQQHLMDFVEQHLPGAGVSSIVEPLAHSTTTLPLDGLSPARRIEGADIATTLLAAIGRLGASMIVMGTRGRTRSASLLLGSVTEQVMQRAHCPVLALKHSHSPMGLATAILQRLKEPSTAVTAN